MYVTTHRMSELFCSRCGTQAVLVEEGADYYHICATVCLACGREGCMESFNEWETQPFKVVGGLD